jgi:hypothetical protein
MRSRNMRIERKKGRGLKNRDKDNCNLEGNN